RRDARGWLEILTGHEPFDALVGVAETLFEAHHRLAARREAKVAGLDDSGMDRTDRDLVQAWSFGGQEAIRRPLDRASWRSRSGGGWSRGGALLREERFQHDAPTRAGSPRDGTRRRSFPAGRFRPPPRAAGAGPWVQAARRAACDAGGCRRRPGRAAAARAR